MSGRVNRRGWIVLSSVGSEDSSRCVDFFERPSGGFGYEQFRSDPEDLGGWTPISGYSAVAFESLEKAVEHARSPVGWLPGRLSD